MISESVSDANSTLPERLVRNASSVFDDAVVDNRDATSGIQVRMGIGHGHATMGGPTCVADGDPGECVKGERRWELSRSA